MLIVYVRGGDKTAPEVSKYFDGGGARSDYKTYERPTMLDWDFKKRFDPHKWQKYLRAIEKDKPVLAMVPDYFRSDEKLFMLRNVEQVKEAGAQYVMVCPKFAGAVADIPEHCIVAISVPTKYAGFLPERLEVIGRKLHFLGGHPDQHLALMRVQYAGIEVFSIDANVLAMQAGYGKWWSAYRGDWVQEPPHKYDTLTLSKRSAKMIVKYMSNRNSTYKMNERVRKCLDTRIIIRSARECDLDPLKKSIANKYRQELDYVMIQKLRRSMGLGTLIVAERDNEIVGFVHYHARRDGTQTVYEIAVRPDVLGQGIGEVLLNNVPLPLQLKSTEENTRANAFYTAMGLQCVGMEHGKKRKLVLWKKTA